MVVEQRDGIKIELPRPGIIDQESIRNLQEPFSSTRNILKLSAFHIYEPRISCVDPEITTKSSTYTHFANGTWHLGGSCSESTLPYMT